MPSCGLSLQARFDEAMHRLGPWPETRRVAVAVSGGADSLCLATLAKAWGNPSAFIVDHGLRPGSAEEARQAAAQLAAFGVPAQILALSGLRAGPGLAARAREARYAALARVVREAGLCDLLLGHHADDQAETVLMRSTAGSGADGLAGMASVMETATHRLVRPLLGMSTAALRCHLRASCIGWAEDPGNSDGVALRSRLRLELARDPHCKASLLEEAARNGDARARREMEVADILARRATVFPQGHALLSHGAISAAALAALLRSLSGARFPLPSKAVGRLAANPAPATLGGVRLLAAGRLGRFLLLVREASAMQPPVPAAPDAVWDGRFRLGSDVALPEGATLGALGGDSWHWRRASHLPDAVLRTLPAIRIEGEVAAVPHLGFVLERPTGAQLVKLWTLPSWGVTLHPAHPVTGAPFAPSRASGMHVEMQAGMQGVRNGRAHPMLSDTPAA